MKNFILYTLFTCLCINLNAHGNRLVLGVHSNAVSTEKAKMLGFENPNGHYITSVNQNTAAADIGLQAFDYVYAIDGEEFQSAHDLRNMLSQKNAGDMISVSYIRNGAVMTGKGKLRTSAESKRIHRGRNADPFLGVDYRYSKEQDITGTRVSIVSCSTAKAMGLQNNDIITKIDNYPIIDWHDVSAAIDAREVGEPITVTVNRDGQTISRFATGIKSLAATHERPCPEEEDKIINESPERIIAQQTQEESEEDLEAEIEMLERPLLVDMQNVSQEEADAMKQSRNIDMPIVNNLKIEALNIFPNPNNGIFNINFELPEQDETIIRVFNSSGRMIYEYDLGNFSGIFQDQIDISNNAVGTYFLQIMQGESSLSKKVIVQEKS